MGAWTQGGKKCGNSKFGHTIYTNDAQKKYSFLSKFNIQYHPKKAKPKCKHISICEMILTSLSFANKSLQVFTVDHLNIATMAHRLQSAHLRIHANHFR